jgi:hypothetical protein
MSMMGELATLRAQLTAAIENRFANLFGWTLTSASSAMGDADQVQSDDEKTSQRPVRRIEPWGLRGRSPSGVRSFWVKFSSSNILFLGIAPTKSYGPTGIDEGETELYCSAGGTSVKLDKDGNVTITAATGKDVTVTGDNVAINGTAFALPKWDDFIGSATVGLKRFLTQLDLDLNLANIATYATGPTTAVGKLQIDLAAAGDYKSTKATNG